jgi:nitrogen regulatory protein PII
MKLILITAIAEFGKDVKQILKKANVKTFSYKEVKGYRDGSEDAISSNWFGTEMYESDSLLFYAFVQKENVDNVYDFVKLFNEKQNFESHIHLAILNIEKTN